MALIPRITREEFENEIRMVHGIEPDELDLMNIEIVRCRCASPHCNGWVLKHKSLETPIERRAASR